MRYLISSLLVAAAAALCVVPARADEPAGKGKIRVLLTFGGHGFEEKPFFAMFDSMSELSWTKAPMPKSAELLKPGLEKDFDVIVMYDMVGSIKPEEQKAFVELLEKGIGVVALHHNMGAHQEWPEFTKIIGGKFCGHPQKIDGKQYGTSGWDHDQDMKIAVADKEHPITRGLADFAIHDEVYNKYYVAPDVKVLLTTDHPKNDKNIAWVKEYGKSRVFYFMLGHDSKAWACPSYKQVLGRGIAWAAGK
jgi:uncharacterized protein